MIWSGALVLLGGAILAFAVGGHAGAVDVRTAGLVAMAFGGVLLVVGIVRLNRVRRRGSGRGTRRAVGQDLVYRTSKGKIIAMIAAVIYILSPVDLVPDVFLPVGIVDDATAFTWLLFAIGQEISRKRRNAV